MDSIPDLSVEQYYEWLEVILDAKRFNQTLEVLQSEFGIQPEKTAIDGWKDNGIASRSSTWPDYLRDKLRWFKNRQELKMSELRSQIRELEAQIPKTKELTLPDGTTYHVIDED